MTDLDRLMTKVDASGDCWEWTGTRYSGYGRCRYQGRAQNAHRAVWLELVGPIADGLEIDHLCRNRSCVNPDHLEPVTHLENYRRSGHWGPKRTHCLNGHPYWAGNVKVRADGVRICRTCVRDRSRERWRRKSGYYEVERPEGLTTDEYAEQHGLPSWAVRQMCSVGDIPGARKAGGRWVIPVEDAS